MFSDRRGFESRFSQDRLVAALQLILTFRPPLVALDIAGPNRISLTQRLDRIDILTGVSVDYRVAGRFLSRLFHLSPTCERGGQNVAWWLARLNGIYAWLNARFIFHGRTGEGVGVPTPLIALVLFLQGAPSINDHTPLCDNLKETLAKWNAQGEQCVAFSEFMLACVSALIEGAHTLLKFNSDFRDTIITSWPLISHKFNTSIVSWPSVSQTFAFDPSRVLIQIIQRIKCDGIKELMMAEVGVRDAQTSVALLNQSPCLHMLLVDPYDLNVDKSQILTGAEQARHLAMARTAAFAGRATHILEASVEAAATISHAWLDIVFIDADHKYASCKADIEAWWPSLRPGGIMAGHDYHIAWPGVVKAVHEFANNLRLRLFLSAGVWWVTKPKRQIPEAPDVSTQHADRYYVRGGRNWRNKKWFNCCNPKYVQHHAHRFNHSFEANLVPQTTNVTSSSLKNKLAAVLVTGHKRSLLSECDGKGTVADNIQERVFQQMLGDSEPFGGFDVFWLLDTMLRASEPKPGDITVCEPLRPHMCATCSLICEVVFERSSNLRPIPASVLRSTWANRVQSILYTLTAFKRIYKLMELYAEENRLAYDWIVRLRPDVLFLKSLPRIHTLPSASVIFVRGAGDTWQPWDYFAVGKASAMRVFFTTADGLNQSAMHHRLSNTFDTGDVFSASDSDAWRWGTETAILHWLDMHGTFLVEHPAISVKVCRGWSLGFSQP